MLSNLESWIPVRPGSTPIAEDEDDEDDEDVALRLAELAVGRDGDDGTRWCWKLWWSESLWLLTPPLCVPAEGKIGPFLDRKSAENKEGSEALYQRSTRDQTKPTK